jgi:hypothetical protein
MVMALLAKYESSTRAEPKPLTLNNRAIIVHMVMALLAKYESSTRAKAIRRSIYSCGPPKT